jgi:hypothetical protein
MIKLLIILNAIFLTFGCNNSLKHNMVITSNEHIETQYFAEQEEIKDPYYIDSKSLIENLIIN